MNTAYKVVANLDLQGNDLKNVFNIVAVKDSKLSIDGSSELNINLKDIPFIKVSNSEKTLNDELILVEKDASGSTLKSKIDNIDLMGNTSLTANSPKVFIKNKDDSSHINLGSISGKNSSIEIKSSYLNINGDDGLIQLGKNPNLFKLSKNESNQYNLETNNIKVENTFTIHDLEICWDEATQSVLFKGQE